MFGFRLTRGSTVLCFIFVLIGFPAHAGPLRAITFEDLDGVKTGESFVGTSLDISPDGKYVAVEHGFDLQVIDAGTERPLHDLGSGIEPRFSPDGEKLARSEEHTSELQSLMRISYAVFCLKTQTKESTTPQASTQHHN